MRINKRRFIRSGLVTGLLAVGFGSISPLVYGATASNTDFKDYLFRRCQDPNYFTPRDADDTEQLQQAQRNFDLCAETFPGTIGAEEVNDANIVVFSDVGAGGGT